MTLAIGFLAGVALTLIAQKGLQIYRDIRDSFDR